MPSCDERGISAGAVPSEPVGLNHSLPAGGSPDATAESLTSQTIATIAGNAVIGLAALATGSLAARFLGPAGRGELAAIQAWPSFLVTISSFGIADAIVFFSAKDPRLAGRYFSSGLLLALLFGLPAMAAGYWLMPALLRAQSPGTITAARWYLLFVPTYSLVALSLNPLRGTHRLKLWNALRVMPPLVWLAVLLVAASLHRATAGIVSAAYLVGLAILAAPTYAVVRTRLRGSVAPSPSLFRPMLRYGAPLLASNIPLTLNLRLDQMLMAAFLDPKLLGYYAAAAAWGSASTPLLTAMGYVSFPRIAAASSPAERNHVLARITRMTALLAALATVGLLAITPAAMKILFGSPFGPALPSACLLTVGGGIFAFNITLEETLRGLNKTTAILWGQVSALIITALGLAILLPRYGIFGAAVASVLAYGTTTVVLTAQIVALSGLRRWQLFMPQKDDWQAPITAVRSSFRRGRRMLR